MRYHSTMSADIERWDPPNDPRAFESLCLDLWRYDWHDPNAQKNGRSGQPQAGVDVFGQCQGKWGRAMQADERVTIRENSAGEILAILNAVTPYNFRERVEELYLGRWTREPGWQVTVNSLPSKCSGGRWSCTFKEVGSNTTVLAYAVQDLSNFRVDDSVTVSGRIGDVNPLVVSLEDAIVRRDNVPNLRRKEELEDAEAASKSWTDDAHGSVPVPESHPTPFGKVPTMIRTVLELDLVGYSTIAATLEAGLDVQTSPKLNQQIQGFVDAGLKAVGVSREAAVMQTTGDGAILVFDRPSQAHVFADAVQQATRTHNATKPAGIGKRVFRVGVATGELVMERKATGGFDIAGMTIARAVRLEAKARPGEVLCDRATFDDLTAEQQKGYAGPETVAGKRDETFEAHRCVLNPDGVKDAAFFTEQTNGAGKLENVAAKVGPSAPSSALAMWMKRLDFLLVEQAKAHEAAAKFKLREDIDEAKGKIRELGGST
jgi:class 3 adenylate cyclase